MGTSRRSKSYRASAVQAPSTTRFAMAREEPVIGPPKVNRTKEVIDNAPGTLRIGALAAAAARPVLDLASKKGLPGPYGGFIEPFRAVNKTIDRLAGEDFGRPNKANEISDDSKYEKI